MLLLAVVAGIAVWRARDDQQRNRSLERRSSVVSALEDARAQLFLGATWVASSAAAEDPALFYDLYRQADEALRKGLAQARAELVAMGEKDELAAVDEAATQIDQLSQELDILWDFSLTADVDARVETAQQEVPRLWPVAMGVMGNLEQLAEEQQAELAAERAAADRAADITLWVLVTSSTAAFVGGAAALAMLILSVLRPLTSLRASARAVASGDLEARAKVSGPEEVTSLARDFNEMVSERQQAEEALQETDQRYRSLFDRSLDAVYIHDFEGRFLDANEAALRLLGYSRHEIHKLSFVDFLDDSQLPAALAGLEEIIKTGRQATPTTFKLRRKDGAFVEAETLAAAVYEGGRPVAVQGIARDITERKRAEERVEHLNSVLRAVTNVNQVLVKEKDRGRLLKGVCDSLTEARGYYNAWIAVVDETGGLVASAEAGLGKDFLPMVERLKRSELPACGRSALAQSGPMTIEDPLSTCSDCPLAGKYGGRGAMVVRLEHGGEVYGVLAVSVPAESTTDEEERSLLRELTSDIAFALHSIQLEEERKRAEEALREQVRRDLLTGVLNHAVVVEELRTLISNQSDGASFALAMVDVNDLKAINDTYGHQVGDAVLVEVARALSRDGAIVGRYGGDEFVAILPGADRDAAERYRDAVLSALAGTDLRDPESGASVAIAVSVGLAIYPTEAGRVEELIKLADSEMYAARRQRPVGPAGRTLPRLLGSKRAAEMVGEIVPLLTSPGDLNEKLRLVAHRLSVGAGYDAVNFALFNSWLEPPPVQNTFARAPEDFVHAWNREQRQAKDVPLRQILQRTRRPIILNDLLRDQRLTDTQRELVRGAGLRSGLVAPMIWQNELIGHLSVASKREAAFGPSDASFLMIVATQVTAIARMATLVEELQSSSARLAEAQAETVMMLAAAAEAHDRTTGLHLQNVHAIAEALAGELGYSEKDAKELGLAAVLHDIGKIRIPDSILASTGRLAEEEWELMKHHTTWGAEFLAGRPGFELAATIARSHHERWDASGYPDGLSGEAIPEAATIVSIADAFDAMISGRPYKARRSHAAGLREIEACSGKQFDPRVAQALVQLHKRKMLPLARGEPQVEKAAA